MGGVCRTASTRISRRLGFHFLEYRESFVAFISRSLPLCAIRRIPATQCFANAAPLSPCKERSRAGQGPHKSLVTPAYHVTHWCCRTILHAGMTIPHGCDVRRTIRSACCEGIVIRGLFRTSHAGGCTKKEAPEGASLRKVSSSALRRSAQSFDQLPPPKRLRTATL